MNAPTLSRWGMPLQLLLWTSICLLLGMSGEARAMDDRDTRFLEKSGEDPIWFAINHKPRRSEQTLQFFNTVSAKFDFIDTVIVRSPARRVLESVSEDFFEDGEIIDESVVERVAQMLTQLKRVDIYKSMGFFPVSALNISIGAPKQLINKRRSGEGAIARAYRRVVARLDIPLVASAGNDGPQTGLVNPWAQTDGVIAAAAADVDGTRIWNGSSRPATYSSQDRYHLFSAHGENTIGALPLGQKKTEAMLAAEREVDLASAVGMENIDRYSVQSGTSFAAATISRLLCYPHQLIQIVSAYTNLVADARHPITPFVRTYIDTAIDENHPIFAMRLADKRKKYSGLIIDTDPQRKGRLLNFFASNAVNLELKYGSSSAIRFLRAISRPIPGVPPNEAGLGFVSHTAAESFVREARYSTLIGLLADEDDDRAETWLARAKAAGDPLLLSPSEAKAVSDYCNHHDLVLALPLSRP